MTSGIKKLVSKKKIRFQEDGFDLDLTYITDRIIAMGFPSEGTESLYRNNMKDVQKFFNKRHAGHYKVYNLCSERKYDPKCFDNSCSHYPFDDHNPSPFETVIKLCEDVDKYLKADPKNVVAIHCKAGKGRTGMMIACYLLWSKQKDCDNSIAALKFYGNKRTKNGKGVTIPSQARWVKYLEKYIKKYHAPKKPFNFKAPPTLTITSMKIGPAPDFDVGGGCDPYFKVTSMDGKLKYNHKKTKGFKVTNFKGSKEPTREFKCDIAVTGEFRVVFWDQDAMSKDDKMFGFWMYTPFITKSTYKLTKNDLDGAVKDKKGHHFKKDFVCEITFKGVKEEAKEDEKEDDPPYPIFHEGEDDDENTEDEEEEFQLPSKETNKDKSKPAPKDDSKNVKKADDSDDDIPPPPPPEEDD